MSIHFVSDNYKTIGTISLGATPVFLALTRLVESEIGSVHSGLSPVVSDEIKVDEKRFVIFVDTFFDQAERSGKFRYFSKWAEEVDGMYQNLTHIEKKRKILGVENFKTSRYSK